jgi:hypothetical protein
MIKSKRKKWADYVIRMRGKRNVYRILWEILGERGHLENLEEERSVILK